jgi:hypothetical protein
VNTDGRERRGRIVRSVAMVETALDTVLRRAVTRNDTGLIDAYRHIFQGATKKPDSNTALRLGLLLGQELNK